MPKRSAVLRATVLLLLGYAVAHRALTAQAVPVRALVLDAKNRVVARVDLSTGTIAERLQLQGAEPAAMLLTPKGDRLIVFQKMEGSWSLRFGFHPKQPVTATIVDPAALRIIKRVDLGWNWPDLVVVRRTMGYGMDLGTRGVQFTPDGRRMIVVCPGYVSNNPAETRPRELFVVDLENGDVVVHLAIDPPRRGGTPLGVQGRYHTAVPKGTRAILSRDASVGYVLDASINDDDKKPLPAVVHAVALAPSAKPRSLTVPGAAEDMVLSSDERFLYVFDPGPQPKIIVVSTTSLAVEKTIPLGTLPTVPLVDAKGRVLVAGGSQGGGQLLAIDGGDVVKTVAVTAAPRILALSADRRVLAVAGSTAVSTLNADTLEPLKTTLFGPSGTSDKADRSNALPTEVTDMLLAPDGASAVTTLEGTTRIAFLNLVDGKITAEVRTGLSSREKFGRALEGIIVGAAGAALNQAAERRTGVASNVYNTDANMFMSRNTSTFLSMREDGKYTYAYSAEADRITAIETGTGKTVAEFKDVGFRGRVPLLQPPGTPALVIVRGAGVSIIDTSQQKLGQPFKGGAERGLGNSAIRDFALRADYTHALVIAGDDLWYVDIVRNTATLTKGLEQPVMAIFEPAR